MRREDGEEKRKRGGKGEEGDVCNKMSTRQLFSESGHVCDCYITAGSC